MSASTVCVPPCTTVKRFGGKPHSAAVAAMRFAVSGVCGDGLSTNAFPAAIAIGAIHSGIIAGKLNGVMPAQTPSG